MNNEQILKQAIEKAEANGWGGETKNYYWDSESYEVDKPGCPSLFELIFSHDFAKAFWGEERVSSCCGAKVYTPKGRMMEYCKKCKGMLVEETYSAIAWALHLQQMVLKKEPLKYIEKFLDHGKRPTN